MLHSIKQLYGDKLGASDGDIGHVTDFYFDDRTWVIRYLVADTGAWLPGRKVLIAPRSIGPLDMAGRILNVKLTRDQIEHCPSIESHKPVSRQYEEEYHRYYGWPCYWQGDGLGGMTGFPILEPPMEAGAVGEVESRVPMEAWRHGHLRSAQAVNGYHIKASDGPSGHVCDFLVDARSWSITQVVVKIGHRFSGREVHIPTRLIEGISYEDSTVSVNMLSAEIAQSPIHHLTAVSQRAMLY